MIDGDQPVAYGGRKSDGAKERRGLAETGNNSCSRIVTAPTLGNPRDPPQVHNDHRPENKGTHCSFYGFPSLYLSQEIEDEMESAS